MVPLTESFQYGKVQDMLTAEQKEERLQKFLATVVPYERPKGHAKAAIVDIDGTIARNVSRGHYEYERVSEDEYIDDVFDTVKLHYDAGYKLFFITGRKEFSREDTKQFIIKRMPLETALPFKLQPDLLMRGNNDHRPDYEIKYEHFNKIRNFDVRVVFEDRTQVVRMWRKLGLTTFQVADGNF